MGFVTAPDKDPKAVASEIKSVLKIVKVGHAKGATANVFMVAGKTDYAMVATLSKKDKSGTRAMSLGKKLRTQVSGGRWARGVAYWDGKRFVFEVAVGNLSQAGVKELLRGKVAKEGSLSFLKRAVVIKPGEDVEEAIAEDSASDDSFRKALASKTRLSTRLNRKEQATLHSIMDDPKLETMRESLAGFLSLTEDEVAEQREESARELQRLLEQSESEPDNDTLVEAMNVQMRRLMEASTHGEHEFAQVPGPIDGAVLQQQMMSGLFHLDALLKQYSDLVDEDVSDSSPEDDEGRRETLDRLSRQIELELQ